MTMSTHKTLPGPQHGMIVTNDDEKFELIKEACFPGLLSNHHPGAVAALAVALAELKEFGKEYADQIIKNAKALAQAMYDSGLKVLGADKGFTECHQVLVDVADIGGGLWAEKALEEANIIVNRNLLPWDIKRGRNFRDPGGIRIGTLEITRLGMKEGEMEEIARFYKRVLLDKEDPKVVAKDVKRLRERFRHIHYSFESMKEAYTHIKLR
ncbi:MAG: serine hydroxymethyltransferase, partial [Thermoproteota archaeon]